MRRFEPSFEVQETSQNTREFVAHNMDVMWRIFKPLAPYIAFFTVLDIAITELYMPIDPDTGLHRDFALGSLIAGYFQTCLVISWHRVVIHGADDYTPMNPFKPTKAELKFIGAIIAIVALIIFSALVVMIPLAIIGNFVLVYIIGFIAILMLIKVGLKLSFYFPARATGNKITFRESFRMTNGYIMKLLYASFWAPLKVIGQVLLYLVGAFCVVFALSFIPMMSEGIGFILMTSALAMPFALYFSPILTVIGVTVFIQLLPACAAQPYRGA